MNTPYSMHQDAPTELDRHCERMGVKDFRMRIVIFANMHTMFIGPSDDRGAAATISIYLAYYMELQRNPLYFHAVRCMQKYPLEFWKKPDNVKAFVEAYKDFLTKLQELAITHTQEPL